MSEAEKYADWIVKNADKRGTPEFDTVAQAYQTAKQMSSEEPTLRQKFQASTPMRMVQGARDPIDAAAQLLPRGLEFITSGAGYAPNPVSEFFGGEAKRVDQGISDNERAYEQARKATGQDGMDVARFAGNVLSPANAAVAAKLPAAASTGGRVLQGAFLGGTGGALTPVDTANNTDFAAAKAGQVALGTVAGGVATPLLGKAGDFIAAKVANLKSPSAATLQKTAQEVAADLELDWAVMSGKEQQMLLEQVRKAALQYHGKDPAAAARMADFKAENMPYLQGQVTRDPAQFAREKNLSQLAGTGDPIRQRLSEQGKLLQQKVGQFSQGASDEQSGGATLAKALRDYDEKLAGDVRTAYQTARKSAGKDAEVPLQGLAQDFANTLDAFGDKIPSGVRNQFKKFGLDPDGSLDQRKLFTVEEADKVLKVINANQSNDPATNAALAQLRAAVKKSVTSDAGVDDVFSGARSQAAQRFSLQDAVPALDAAASGRANPDTFVQSYILNKSAQTKEVSEMARVLRENNPEAYDQARAQIASYLQRKAFGENQAGDKPVSPERFAAALRELGEGKLKAFFTDAEVSQMQRLSRISSYVDSVPNASKPNTSGNWAAITNLATKLPGIPTSLALAGALKGSVSNQLGVRDALSGKLPTKLTPEEIRLMSQILSQGSLATGGAVASQLR